MNQKGKRKDKKGKTKRIPEKLKKKYKKGQGTFVI